MASAENVEPDHHVEHDERVVPLELFFDLVFVFAFTQVTSYLSDDPTWEGLARGMLVLAAVWWSWTGYTWLTDSLDPEDGYVRLTLLGAMVAMLIVALAIPTAFGANAVLFASAYLVVRVVHVALYVAGARGDPDLMRSLRGIIPGMLIGPLLILGSSFLDGAAEGIVFAVALLIDFGGTLGGDFGGWKVSPRHFAERHGLIVLIALGESIVALGVGAAGIPLDTGVVLAAVLGMAVVAGLWWAYFDVVAIVAERKLGEVHGEERARQARDSYSFIHLLMIAGIILFALGLKKTLGDVDHHLKEIPAVALCGGVALYFTGHIAFRRRNVHTWSPRRIVTVFACLALIPLALEAPAIVALAAITAVVIALITYERVRYREARARLRAGVGAPP